MTVIEARQLSFTARAKLLSCMEERSNIQMICTWDKNQNSSRVLYNEHLFF